MYQSLRHLNYFKIMSLLVSALYFYLFYLLLLTPQSLCESFGVTCGETAYFIARRASMLMLGFAILAFLLRNTPRSTVRQAIAATIGVNMAGLASLGVYEMVRGFVETSILGIVVIELVIAVTFFSFLITDRLGLKKSNS